MNSTILVTGATGNVGREVISLLADRDCQAIAAVRNPIQAQRSFGGKVRCVLFDFTNPDTFSNAFAGVDRLFLVRPPAIADIRKIAPALSAAKQAGIEQIVFLSILGAERNRFVPHYQVERNIEQLQIPAVFLRASFFMQNLNTIHCEDIRDLDRLFMPAGNGRTSFVDVRDLAAVAAKILTEPVGKDIQRAYDLTGATALTYDEVATIFTTVLGRTIRYPDPSIVGFTWQMLQRGLPLPFVLVMVGIYTTARLGLAGTVTSDLERLLGRQPIGMQQYVEDYRQFWV